MKKRGRNEQLVPLSQREREKARRRALLGIAIRTIWELLDGDDAGVIASAMFNGWVAFVDRSTGNVRSEYILSVQGSRDPVDSWSIERIDPEAAFKALRGMAAPKLDAYIPIRPTLVVDRDDRRIIENREVIDHLEEGENLATMEWDDFEHLVRELLEREWSQHGAEVRVTQASHDRGVDALVFDPDSLRGGKFVIQAKRYTRVVDVSAVRDLYGTVLNEGANRGILITTSHYGPDAYEFAKSKPLTLLTGDNLLGLLEQHGYRFRIDIEEARRLRE